MLDTQIELSQAVLAGLPDAVVLFDAEWRCVYSNPAADQLSPKGSLMGHVFWDLYPELLGTAVERELRGAAPGQVGEFEYFYEPADLWVHIRFQRLESGLVVSARDVTEPKRVYLGLAESEQLFRRFADAMPQIAWVADGDGKIEFLNARWYEFSGHPAGTPIPDQIAASIHPDDIGMSEERWRDVTEHGTTYEAKLRLKDRNGIYRWHLARTVGARNEGGEIIRWYGTSTDIHDMVLAQETLAQNERRFELTFGNAQITAYEQDSDLRYTWLYPHNPYFETHSKGRRDDELLPPDEAQELNEIKQAVLKDGVGRRKTIQATIRDGVHHYDLIVEPLRGLDGNIVGVTGAAIDITDRRKAEAALEESEERFRKAIENSPVPKVIHAEDGEILYQSRAWSEATGQPSDSASTVAELVRLVGGKAPGLSEVFAGAFLEDRADSSEQTIVTRSGSELIWIITSAPLGVLPDGRRLAVSAGIDITDRKRSEDGQRFLNQAGHTLAKSLDYESTLATVAQLAVPTLADWCAVDLLEEGNIKRVAVAHRDPEMVEWARRYQEENPIDLDAPTGVPNVLRTGESELYPDLTDEILAQYEVTEEVYDVIRKLELRSIVMAPLQAHNETLGVVTFVSSTPGRYGSADVAMFEELGRIAGLGLQNARLFRSLERELEERRRAEAEVLRLNASLEERVRARTTELEAANREMEGFTYSVSHDLRAPLRAIISNSMILLEELGGALQPQERERLVRQAAAAKKMGLLIDDLLKLSRLSRQEMSIQPVDLSVMAHDVAEDLRSQDRARDIEFKIQPGLSADGDPRLLAFVISNLFENSCKFSPKGGTVEFGLQDGAFFVRDQGIGFDMAFAHKIFLPFERLVLESEFPGTGIGLANVQRIVQRHGGSIWAESTPGAGATFWFTLA